MNTPTHDNNWSIDQEPSDSVRELVELLMEPITMSPEELASALIAEYKDKDIARACLHSLRQFLSEAAELLERMENGDPSQS